MVHFIRQPPKIKHKTATSINGVSPSKDSIETFGRLNPLSASPAKWSNTLKQFVGNLPTNCLSMFDHFMNLALKGLKSKFIDNYNIRQTFRRFQGLPCFPRNMALYLSNKCSILEPCSIR